MVPEDIGEGGHLRPRSGLVFWSAECSTKSSPVCTEVAKTLKPNLTEIEPEPDLANPSEHRGCQCPVLQAGENVAQATLQRVRRQDDSGARVIESEHGHVPRCARVSVCVACKIS